MSHGTIITPLGLLVSRYVTPPVVADHGPPLGPGRGPGGGLPWRILLSDPGYAGQSAVKGLPRWVRTRPFVRPTRGSAHLRVRVPVRMHEGGGPRVASPTTDRGSGSHRLPQVRHVRVRSTPSRWNCSKLLNTFAVELLKFVQRLRGGIARNCSILRVGIAQNCSTPSRRNCSKLLNTFAVELFKTARHLRGGIPLMYGTGFAVTGVAPTLRDGLTVRTVISYNRLY
jgi:hypothetical protein